MNEVGKIGRATAKLFWTGRSQAVRLPKEFRFDGDEVQIWRENGRTYLAPVEVANKARVERLAGSLDEDFARAVLDDRPGPETLPEWAHLK